ncbi:MAG: hypothetical protein JJU11_16775 [Candidatus Sumerlaeia bacterium]|nr:hypothetical protein [Candidatus Sumerlaeia bacterium]
MEKIPPPPVSDDSGKMKIVTSQSENGETIDVLVTDGAQEILRKHQDEGLRWVYLIPDTENPQDPNTVAVFLGSERVGHLPKKEEVNTAGELQSMESLHQRLAVPGEVYAKGEDGTLAVRLHWTHDDCPKIAFPENRTMGYSVVVALGVLVVIGLLLAFPILCR